MQFFIKSAGKAYDQDYTWTQFRGPEGDYTDFLRKKAQELPVKAPYLAIFEADGKYCLLAGGVKTKRIDIVGTPIVETFAFLSPAAEEHNIRRLAKGILTGDPALKELLLSATQESTQHKAGFDVSENLGSSLEKWLLKEDKENFNGTDDNIISLLQEPLPGNFQKILLICSEAGNQHGFYRFSAQKIDWESENNTAEITSESTEQQLFDEENMDVNDIKIYICTAPKESYDYLWWNRQKPEWAEEFKRNFFAVESNVPGRYFGIAAQRDQNRYCIYLQDDIKNVKDFVGRPIKIKLLLEIPVQSDPESNQNIERGIRNICANWTDADSEYANKMVRRILDSGALVHKPDTFEVDEAKIKQFLLELLRDTNSFENNPGTGEMFSISKDLSNFPDARRWFGEKLRSTCFADKDFSLCFFTVNETSVSGNAAYYCTFLNKNTGNKNSLSSAGKAEECSSAKPAAGKMTAKSHPFSDISSVGVKKNKKAHFIFIGAAVLILLSLMAVKSCRNADSRYENSPDTKSVVSDKGR